MASSQNNIKVENLCRTCLAKEIELFPIFEIFLEATSLNHIITSITGVKIDKSDGLPTKICQECKNKAANAYDFKKKSQESEVTLHGILKKEKDYLNIEDATTLSTEIDGKDVKLERLPSDDPEDFIDLEFNLTLPIDNNDVADEVNCDILDKSILSGVQLDHKALKVQMPLTNTKSYQAVMCRAKLPKLKPTMDPDDNFNTLFDVVSSEFNKESGYTK